MYNLTNNTSLKKSSEFTYNVMLTIFIFMMTGVFLLCCMIIISKKNNRVAPI